ncbi:MAG: 3-isopropylmalate dehydratase small subunit [Rhodobacteraceae bacterium]|nr:3-isopropylmalate dehydratase small subunit [Paracoccaceae bacterium]
MAGWTEHCGQALELAFDNIDTDRIIPARFMSTPRAEGYGQFLLYDFRRDTSGQLLDDFPLNTASPASILIAGRNFGIGSSRESAVYALVDAGFRAIVASSFGDIFASNAVNNGLLPAKMPDDDISDLKAAVSGTDRDIAISIETQTIACGAYRASFAISDIWKLKLQNGWDDVDLTLQHAHKIERYARENRAARPWTWPNGKDISIRQQQDSSGSWNSFRITPVDTKEHSTCHSSGSSNSFRITPEKPNSKSPKGSMSPMRYSNK